MNEPLTTLMHSLCTPAGRWSPGALRRLVEAVAERPELWPDSVTRVDDGRSYRLAFRSDHLELWIISWANGTSTDMHDHGGSVGAMRMIHGSLTETFVVPRGVRRRMLRAGRTTAFPSTYIHDVRNEVTTPALSVQAYSPPLTQMTYYAMSEGGPVPVRTAIVGQGASV